MASMKTVVLNQVPKTKSYGAQEERGRDVGKSGVAAGCHAWFAMQACLAPCHQPHPFPPFFFSPATQLATQLRQRCIQVVCSNKEARKRLSESNGTPAMDLGHMNVD